MSHPDEYNEGGKLELKHRFLDPPQPKRPCVDKAGKFPANEANDKVINVLRLG